MPVLMASRMNENGLSAQLKAWIAGAMMIEVRSAWRAATVFGMVSPKTSRTVVTAGRGNRKRDALVRDQREGEARRNGCGPVCSPGCCRAE